MAAEARVECGRKRPRRARAASMAQQQHVELELLVTHRLFAVHAVGRVLQQGFVQQQVPRLLQPARAVRPVRPGGRGDEYARWPRRSGGCWRRSGATGSRARSARAGARRRASERAKARAGGLANTCECAPPSSCQAIDQLISRMAGSSALAQLGPSGQGQAANQLSSCAIKRGAEARFAGERMRLGQRHQVQVAVRFPQVLDVTDPLRIAVVEQLAETQRRIGAGLRIAVPARRRAELHIAQREYIVVAGHDALGRRAITRGVHAGRGGQPWQPARARGPRAARGSAACEPFRVRASRAQHAGTESRAPACSAGGSGTSAGCRAPAPPAGPGSVQAAVA